MLTKDNQEELEKLLTETKKTELTKLRTEEVSKLLTETQRIELGEQRREELSKLLTEMQRTELEELRREELSKLLSETQKTEFEELRKEELEKLLTETQKTEFEKLQTEEISKLLTETQKTELEKLRKEELSKLLTETQRAELEKLQEEELRKLLSEKQRTEIQELQGHKVLELWTEEENGRTLRQIRTETVGEAVEHLRLIIKQTGKGTEREIRFLNGIGAAKVKMRLTRELEKGLSREHVELWLKHLTKEESEEVWKNLIRESETMVYASAVHVKAGHGEEGTDGIPAAARLRRLVSQAPEAVVRALKKSLAASSTGRTEEHVARIFRKYETEVFRQVQTGRIPENEASLASRVFTIMESRFTEPGKAREAEKELIDILVHDLHVEKTDLIFKEERTERSVQEQEERIQTFLTLLETPKAMAAVRRRIEEADEKSREHLKSWVQKYQMSVILTLQDRQKNELITQVRQTLGSDAAEKLERYFEVRGHAADHAAGHEAVSRMDETVRSIMTSYLNVTRTEDLANVLGGGDSVYLRNRVRETVHEPVSRPIQEARRNLDVVSVMLRRDYRFNQEKIRFLRQIERQTGIHIIRQSLGEGRDTEKYKDMPILSEVLKDSRTYRLGQLGERIAKQLQEQTYPELESGRQVLSQGQSAWSQPARAPQYHETEDWAQAETLFLRRQRTQESELEETRRMVKTLNEKLEIQEKLMTELKKGNAQTKIPPQINVNHLTRQVMKKMEEELRLEKMRRGLL